MMRKKLIRIVAALILEAILLAGCATKSNYSPVETIYSAPTEIPRSEKISIAKDFAYTYQAMLNWNAPSGVDTFSTVSFGSAEMDSNGRVVVKGRCYGRDEYGRFVGEYIFNWTIAVNDSGIASSCSIKITKE